MTPFSSPFSDVNVRGVTIAPQTPQCGGLKGQGDPLLLEKDREILALGSNTTPQGRSPYMVFSAGAPEFEVTPRVNGTG